jgi:hypothetical protein
MSIQELSSACYYVSPGTCVYWYSAERVRCNSINETTFQNMFTWQNLLAYPPSGISHLIQHCIIVSHNNESLNNWKGKRCLLRIDSTFWTKNQDCPNNEAHLQDLSLQKSNFEPLLIMGKLICMLSWVQLLFINLEF